MIESKVKFFADYIQKEIGIIYVPEVYFQLEQRLDKVARFLNLEGPEEVYQKAIKEGISGDFRQFLLDTATNNETSFFRDPKVFQAIENQLLASFQKEHPKNFVYRIWCTAASFGQEPYSLAMLVHEFLKKNPEHPRIEIIATDIADHALKRCKEGKYSQLEIQRGLSTPRLLLYFEKDPELEGYWILKSEIKNRVEFKKQNLLDSFDQMGSFNLILCRYVLIYQDADKKKMIVQKLEKRLVPNGYLIFGASESALGLSDRLKQNSLDGAIYYQVKE